MNKEQHRRIIEGVLGQINRNPNTPFILKGGTALMKCYGLDRFSEDIDLDAAAHGPGRNSFFAEVQSFCASEGFTYRIGKDTEAVQRAFVNYGDDASPLKIEVSYRRAEIADDLVARIDGVKVYKLDVLCQMKTSAYLSRDKLRDLYDVTFICSERFDELSEASRTAIQNAFEYKDLSQLDYLLKTQDDALIDKDLLVDRFLRAYDKVGLLAPKSSAATPEALDDHVKGNREATLDKASPRPSKSPAAAAGNAARSAASRSGQQPFGRPGPRR